MSEAATAAAAEIEHHYRDMENTEEKVLLFTLRPEVVHTMLITLKQLPSLDPLQLLVSYLCAYKRGFLCLTQTLVHF